MSQDIFIIDGINKFCHFAEVCFNVTSAIPIVNTYTTPIRLTAGLAQTIAGIAISIFSRIAQEFTETSWDRDYFAYWTRFGDNHAIHGLANVAQAFVGSFAYTYSAEGALWVALLIIQSTNYWQPMIDYHQYQETGDLSSSLLTAKG